MKRTDYEDVVQRYDDNRTRLNIPPDETLGRLVERAGGAEVAVLDVGCGTGNYLAAQGTAFAGRPVSWFGIDPSPGMLARAAVKLDGVDLRRGRAEELPYPAQTFDFVSANFMFHHVENKGAALDEIARVLKLRGVFQMWNVAPERMPGWWCYAFFPETRIEDEQRFWSMDLIGYELEARGFDASIRATYERSAISLRDVLAEAERRDASQLANLADPLFERGLRRIRGILEEDPAARYFNEFVLFHCTAQLGRPPGALWRG